MSDSERVKLKFDQPVIVLGGGNLNLAVLKPLVERGYPVVAADGAADEARRLGVPLNVIIGDFDSVQDTAVFEPSVSQFKISEQETTDFEKCLYSVEAPLFICFGMLGKRFDHSLAALHTVTRFCNEKHIILIDEHDASLGVNGVFEMALPSQCLISIYPLVPTQFDHSEGLLYPLDGLLLEAGKRIGTSNETNAERVKMKPRDTAKARYLVTLPITQLDAMIYTVAN